MTRTAQLANWVATVDYSDLPQDTVDQAKKLLLKTVAGMLFGCREPIGRIMTSYLSEMGGRPVAGVVGAGFRTSAENAALANGTFAHASELEDNELPSITSDYWMFPALFPMAEKCTSSGREVITAAVIMWEVASRFCRAAEGWRYMTKHVPPPSWFGPLGVAAGSARLLGSSASQIENAINLAGSYACGIGHQGYDGHFLESGHSCQMGVLAANLTRAGATAEPGCLEVPNGIYAPVWSEGQVDLDRINAGLGQSPYLINQASIKKFGCCTYTHTSIDALMTIMRTYNLTNDDIVEVKTEVSSLTDRFVGQFPEPDSVMQAVFSMHFVLGETLVRGRVETDSFAGPEVLADAEREAASRKVNIEVDQALPPESVCARVTVTTRDGEQKVQLYEHWIGSPLHPLTLEQTRDVCMPYLQTRLDGKACERVADIILNLEKQPDLYELMEIITCARVGHRLS